MIWLESKGKCRPKRVGRLRGNRILPLLVLLLASAALWGSYGAAIGWKALQAGGLPVSRQRSVPSSAASLSSAGAAQSSSEVSSSSGAGVSRAYRDNIIDRTAFFGNSFFLGDSITLGIQTYKVLDNARVFGTNGMSAGQALTAKFTVDGKTMTFPEAAAQKKPQRVFLLIGANDVTFSAQSSFIASYGRLIDAVAGASAQTKIYVQSIFPVTAQLEAAKPEKYSNSRIDSFNAALRQLCTAKGVVYADVASIMKGSDGKMMPEYAGGGVNISLPSYYRWMNYLSYLG